MVKKSLYDALEARKQEQPPSSNNVIVQLLAQRYEIAAMLEESKKQVKELSMQQGNIDSQLCEILKGIKTSILVNLNGQNYLLSTRTQANGWNNEKRDIISIKPLETLTPDAAVAQIMLNRLKKAKK